MRSVIVILLCGSLIGCAVDQGQQEVVQEQLPDKTLNRAVDCLKIIANSLQGKDEPVALAECREYIEHKRSVPGEDSQDLGRLGKKENPVTDKESFKNDEDHVAVDELGKAIKQGLNGEETYAGRINKGDFELSQGNLFDAIEEYSQAITLDSDRAEAYIKIGTVKLEQGEYQSSINNFEKAITKDRSLEEEYEIYFNKGVANSRLKNNVAALIDYLVAFLLFDRAEVYFNRGIAWSKTGHQDEAINDFTLAIIKDPYLAEAYIKRGDAKMEKGDFNGAIVDYEKAGEMDLGLAEQYVVLISRGEAKSGQGELDHALEDYDQAIDIYSDIATAYIKRGHVKFTKGDYTGADEDYERAMNSNPFEGERYEIHLYRGRIELKEGRTRQAIGNFNLAIEMDEGRPEAYNRRGLARLIMFEDERNNDVELKWEINADFTAAIKAAIAGGLDQEQYVAEAYRGYINRGMLKLRVSPDRIDDALDDFDLAIELDDTRPEAYINRGDTMLLKDDPAAAINDYGQAIATETEQVLIEGYLKRGKAYLIMQDHLSAIDNYGRVIDSGHALDNELIEALFSRGLSMSELGSYWDAINDFDDAINQLKSVAGKHDQRQHLSNIYLPLHYYRGTAKLQLGQAEDALLDFGRAKTEYQERESSQTTNGDRAHVRVQIHQIITQEGNAYNKLNKPKEADEAFAHASTLEQDRDSSIYDSHSSFANDVLLYFAK